MNIGRWSNGIIGANWVKQIVTRLIRRSDSGKAGSRLVGCLVSASRASFVRALGLSGVAEEGECGLPGPHEARSLLRGKHEHD
jgi:hypothetical protein